MVFVVTLSEVQQLFGSAASLSLFCASLRKMPISIMALLHGDIEPVKTMSDVAFDADTIFCVQTLSTGGSKDYDGKCLVASRQQAVECLYTVSDTRIRFFQK